MNRSLLTRTLTFSFLTLLLTSPLALAQQPQTGDLTNDRLAGADAAFDDVADEADEAEGMAKTDAVQSGPGQAFRAFTQWCPTNDEIAVIYDPLADGHPEAAVIVTHDYKPYENEDSYTNAHNIGVEYREDLGKWTIFNQDFTKFPGEIYFNVRIGGALLHRATGANTVNGRTIVDDSRGNNNPNARLQITSVVGPGGLPKVYVDHPVGVVYNGSKWEIVHLDSTPVLTDECYFVLFDGTLKHTTSAANVTDHMTVIDNTKTNGNRYATLVVTPTAGSGNPNSADEHPVGVWYNGSKWVIFNEDLTPMPEGASFNVTVYEKPAFTSFFIRGTKLIVTGTNFSPGAVIILDGVDQVTKHGPYEGANSRLRVRNIDSVIAPGQTVKLQVRNADGLLSNAVNLTR